MMLESVEDEGDEGRLCKLVTMEVVQRWDYPDGGLCKLDLEEYLRRGIM